MDFTIVCYSFSTLDYRLEAKYTEDTSDPYRIQRDHYPLPIRRSFFDSTGG